MTTYISFAAYIIPEMGMVAGFWECELTRVVQKVAGGGAVRILNDAGNEAIVRVEKFDPGRFGTDTFCY